MIFGCANQAGEDNRNVARMATLLAGLPAAVSGTAINRLCGSGRDAIGAAAPAIRAGEIDLAIAGGAESMTRAPLVMAKPTEAFARVADIQDTTIGWRFVNPVLKAQYGIDSIPGTAENVAEDFQISREDRAAEHKIYPKQVLHHLPISGAREAEDRRNIAWIAADGDHSADSTATSVLARRMARKTAGLRAPPAQLGPDQAWNRGGCSIG